MELQAALDAFTRAGTAVFAISYDSVEVLADFAEKHGITYPLLSDEGSRTIRALGLYNEHLADQAAFYGRTAQPHQFGVPYPGLFLLNERGVIEKREFEQSYRVRPTAEVLAESLIGSAPEPAASAEVSTPEVSITAWLGSRTYRPYQRLRLHVDLRLGPGLHVYGPPVPSGMVPLTIRIEPLDGLEVADVVLPAPHPMQTEGIEEEFFVYEGAVSAVVPFAIIPTEPEVRLAVEVGYQVCSEYACYPPATARLELPLAGLELVRD